VRAFVDECEAEITHSRKKVKNAGWQPALRGAFSRFFRHKI